MLFFLAVAVCQAIIIPSYYDIYTRSEILLNN